MATATQIQQQIQGLPHAERTQIVKANYKNWTEFYEAVLAERKDSPSYKVQIMCNFVAKYSWVDDFSSYWAEYFKQQDIDNGTSELDAFLDQHGLENVYLYDKYADLSNDYGVAVVEEFIQEFGVLYIKHFQDSYRGIYDSVEDFVEEMVSSCENLPYYCILDYDAMWRQYFQYDYTYDANSGAVFATNF